MKKLMAVILFSVVALTGCNGGDNGELAGVYIDSDMDKLLLDAKDGQYEVSYQYIWKGKYGTPKTVGFAKKDGNYLVASDQGNKKMFEIKDDELVSVYTESKRTFKKIESAK